MQFKDAAYEILKKAGQPLHYKEIAARAKAAGLLETTGQTPEATMGAQLYTDTLDPDSRFRRGDQRGTFTLKSVPTGSIQQQIENIHAQVRKDLRKQLLQMPPQKFEELIRSLLERMGFEETETTPYSNDKGVDVRGVLRSNPLSVVKVAIQAKRWTNNVGSGVVSDVRGALKIADSEQGLIITPSGFTPSAVDEAHASGKTLIQLINGDQLVELLIQHKVGVKEEQLPFLQLMLISGQKCWASPWLKQRRQQKPTKQNWRQSLKLPSPLLSAPTIKTRPIRRNCWISKALCVGTIRNTLPPPVRPKP